MADSLRPQMRANCTTQHHRSRTTLEQRNYQDVGGFGLGDRGESVTCNNSENDTSLRRTCPFDLDSEGLPSQNSWRLCKSRESTLTDKRCKMAIRERSDDYYFARVFNVCEQCWQRGVGRCERNRCPVQALKITTQTKPFMRRFGYLAASRSPNEPLYLDEPPRATSELDLR